MNNNTKTHNYIYNPKEIQLYNKYASTVPVNSYRLARDLGIVLKESDELPSGVGGFIKKIDDEVFMVFSAIDNEKTGEALIKDIEKRHAVILTQIGHFFLHKEHLDRGLIYYDNLESYDEEDLKIEKEARAFASNILNLEDKILLKTHKIIFVLIFFTIINIVILLPWLLFKF